MSIYLDNAATTKAHDDVLATMAQAERDMFYNSAALYTGSVVVNKVIREAENTIRARLDRRGAGQLIFTSGATESNNIVMLGKITSQRHHLVVAAGEHSSTYAPSVALKNDGFTVDYIPLLKSGHIDVDAISRIVKSTTTLVCFSMVNSDTGALQPVRKIVDAVRRISPKCHVHCDAVQGFAKFDFDVADMGLDSASISAHKIYGPKGIGGLWVRKGVNLRPIMYGGAQQDFRPGTESNASILGFAKAVEVFETKAMLSHVKSLHARLVDGLPRGCTINGDNTNPYITNIMLPVLGQTVMNALSSRGIYVGLGSACSSRASKNRTLIAMGIPEAKTKNVIRISLGRNNTNKDIDTFNDELAKILDDLR